MTAQDGAIPAQAEAAQAAPDLVDISEELRLKARRRERLMSIGSPVALLLAWEAAARFGLVDVRFFPAPSAIVLVMIRMLAAT